MSARSKERRYELTEVDREFAEFMQESIPSGFLYPPEQIEEMGTARRELFFRVIAPKYGFDPKTAKFAGSRREPSWDVLAVPKPVYRGVSRGDVTEGE